MTASRSQPLGFAARTLKNLDYITQAYPNPNVHVVAQTGNSILGLIVFPYAKGLHKPYESKKLADLVTNDGWPAWNINGSSCETLGELLRNLRNAVTHGRWSFDSDDRDCSAVRIKVELEKKSWEADIGCTELQLFCRKFVELLDSSA